MVDLLKAALLYTARGWSIIPIAPPGHAKEGRPLVKWACFQKKRPAKVLIKQWWSRWPNASIAMICGSVSDVVIIDVDPRHGGLEDFEPLAKMVTDTGGGGAHHFYGYPLDQKHVQTQVNTKSKDPTRKGRDVKADESYVILPPSIHRSGKRYKWRLTGKLIHPPNWVLRTSKIDSVAKDKKSWISDLLTQGTKYGLRNEDTTKLAGYLVSPHPGGLPLDIATQLIENWLTATESDRTSGDGFDDAEVEKTVRSVYTTEKRKKRISAKKGDSRSVDFRVMEQSAFMETFGGQAATWAIEEWLPRSTVGFIVSPPGAFKSWLTFDLAQSIAGGYPFLGKYKTYDKGPVLIIQQEDFTGQTAERNALILMSRAKLKPPNFDGVTLDFPVVPEIPVYYHPDRRLKFQDKEVMDTLYELLKKLRPKLMIVDPFYMAGDLDDYGLKSLPRMEALKDWRDEFDMSSLIVHHTVKGAEWGRRGMWGSAMMDAFAETLWHVRRPEDGNILAVRRYFKSHGFLPYVRLSMDINYKTYTYSINSTEISKEEADGMVSFKSKSRITGSRRIELSDRVLEVLATSEGSLISAEIALILGVDQDGVDTTLIKLLQRGDIERCEKGWVHAVPKLA